MIPVRDVVEVKSIPPLYLRPHRILKVLIETAEQKSMSAVRPAGMVVMMVIGVSREWDTVLTRYAQGRSVNKDRIARKGLSLF